MQIYLVTALLFALIVAIFAVQNTYTVDIIFIAWKLKEIPLILVIIGSTLIGAIVVFLLGMFKQLGTYKQLMDYRKANKKLLNENEKLQETLDAIKQEFYEEVSDEQEEIAEEIPEEITEEQQEKS